MANSKSATKRISVNEKKRLANQTVKTDMRSAIRKVVNEVENNNVEEAKATLAVAVKKIDKASQHGVIHKNNANRKKSQLAKRVNKLAQ